MRKKLLLFPIGVCLVLALVAMPFIWVFAGGEPEPPEEVEAEEIAEEPAPPEPKTVKIGYLAPLTGPAAMWGIPPITGVKIWQTRVNEEGGLNVGGEKYLVEVVYYDDEMTGSKALEGAKKLVLIDDVKMMTVMSGPPATAVCPFTTEHKVITFNPNVFETRPTRPYMFSAGDNWPFCDSMELNYYAMKYPGRIKRIAFTCQDDYLGYYGLSIVKAFAEAYGFEVVYETLFSTTTTDFAPIMSAVLATDPDLISFGGVWGDFRAALIEQAYLQGVKPGEILWHASEWLLTADLEKVPAEMLEGAAGAFPDCDDAILPETSHKFWDDWHARFGPGGPEDEHREFTSADWYSFGYCNNWELGVEAAGTFDADAVRKAILALDPPTHVFGAVGWWGEELQGVSQTLAIRQFITEVRDGKHVAVDEIDFFDWVEKNIAPIVNWMGEYKVLWWQM